MDPCRAQLLSGVGDGDTVLPLSSSKRPSRSLPQSISLSYRFRACSELDDPELGATHNPRVTGAGRRRKLDDDGDGRTG